MTERAIEVRWARSDDEPVILELVERLVEFGPPPWRDPAQMVQVDREKISHALRFKGDDRLVVVATIGGAVAGFVHVHSLTDHYNDQPHGHISDVVVAPAFEGMGVGRRLLGAAREWAVGKKYRWLTISVFQANRRALTIYTEAGFEPDILRLVQPLE